MLFRNNRHKLLFETERQRIADMEYREQLLKVLIPMQMELDGTAEIYETDGEITNEIEMEM